MSILDRHLDYFLSCLIPGLSSASRATHQHLFKYVDESKKVQLCGIFDDFQNFVLAQTGKAILESSEIEILDCWKGFALESRQSYLQFSSSLLQGYYADSKVLQDLGLRHTATFPLGIKVHQADLSMLEPVFNRGPIFRC